MLTLFSYIFRSLRQYWRVQLSVLLATAVATAVLSGSLIIGDSIKASLRDLALDRLGSIEHVLVSDLFFRNALSESFPRSSGAILLNGSAVHADSGARAARIQVIGVTDSFWAFDNAGGPKWTAIDSQEVVLNETLAREIGADEGDDVLIRLQKPSAIARETFLGERDDTVVTLRLRVSRIMPTGGIGDISLSTSQRQALNVFVLLGLLQQRLDQPARINAILAGKQEESLDDVLRKSTQIEDAGLRIRRTSQYTLLESERIYLSSYEEGLGSSIRPSEDSASLKEANIKSLSYLANELRIGDRSVPYSTVVAVDQADLREGEILLNAWTGEDLGAKPESSLTLTYFMESGSGELVETTATLMVAGILPMDDWRVSADLVPDFPGVSDAEKMSDWRSPFPIDLSRIRKEDEDYWDLYRAQPKAVVSLATGQKMWANRYGRLTSIGWRAGSIDATAIEKQLRNAFDPIEAGLSFRNVRVEMTKASQGSSDFSGLFIGFSLFLILSAAMLIQILFSLGVEQRSRELGLLGALGLSEKRISLMLLGEGAIVALGGAVVGMLLALAYARLLVEGLNTIWLGAIGTSFVKMMPQPSSLAIGAGVGWIVAMLSMLLCIKRLRKLSPRTLLSGRTEIPLKKLGKRKTYAVAGSIIFLACGALLLGSRVSSAGAQSGLFFSSGVMLLVAGLFFFRSWLASGSSDQKTERLYITLLGFRSARRRAGRSILVAGLVASSTFLIVAVGANRQSPSQERGLRSGTGGFALLANSSLPLYRPLNDIVGDFANDGLISESFRAFAFRLREGDDASCLNLYRALRPRILGVGSEFINRGGFEFGGLDNPSSREKQNPWLLLDRDTQAGAAEDETVIPAIGDYNTVVWLLHSGLGKEISIDGHRFRIVGLLKKSIFQSELLISEANFQKAFPKESGWRYFAIESIKEANSAKLSAQLEETLEDYGFDAVDTREHLASLLRIENTYLSMFQSLGGLGLLLGTLGLSLVVARNLLERQAEFALLSALGFRRSALVWLGVSENVLLLLVGLAIGVFSALLASGPALIDRAERFPWLSVGALIILVLAIGIGASWVVTSLSLRRPILRSLSRE